MNAAKELFGDLDNKEFIDLFSEFEKGETREAKTVRQLDKIEMAMQALEYEKEQGRDLTEFFESASLVIEDPLLRKLMEEIIASRPKG